MTSTDANSAHPAEVCAVHLTEPQRLLLRGLVARAAQDEHERVRRMNARPPGSHSPAKLAEAARDRDDLAAIEAAIESAIEAAPSRKLGENDPGRYEIAILVGPCTLEEATAAMHAARDAVVNLGAAASLTTWDESW